MPFVYCDRCHRRRYGIDMENRIAHAHVVSVTMNHASYGCSSGCCGHRFEAYDCTGALVTSDFEFVHFATEDAAKDALRAFARQFGKPKLDWFASSFDEY